MNGKILTLLIGLTLTLSLVLGLLYGCGVEEVPIATSPTATAQSPTLTPTASPKTTITPSPINIGSTIEWRCQSSKSAGDFLWMAERQFFDDVNRMSGGWLHIDVVPAGTIVSRDDILDAVGSGAVECASGVSDTLWIERDPLFTLGSIPAGMDLMTQILWENYSTDDDPISPGEKLFGELYAKYNIKAFNSSFSGPYVDYMSKTKILGPDDYSGLVLWVSSKSTWASSILTQPELGAGLAFLDPRLSNSGIYDFVVDAYEGSSTLAALYRQGYQDVTKYWGFPGMHNQSQTGHFLINMDAWNKLPPDLQKIVEVACKAQQLRTTSYNVVESAKVIQELQKKGITLVYQNAEVQTLWYKTMLKTVDTIYAEKSPEFKPEFQKAMDFKYMIEAYLDLQRPVYDATYPGKKETIPGLVWE